MKNILPLFACMIIFSCSSPVKPEIIKEDVCTKYACPIHQDKTSSKPAECPECHRQMVSVNDKEKNDTAPPEKQQAD